MGTFTISKRINGFYKYEFVSRKGKTIFTSKDFELRFECEEEIDYLKNKIQTVIFLPLKSTNGKFYFKFFLDDKELAISRKYTTKLLMQKGIDEILNHVNQSEILDFSSNDAVFSDF